MYEFLDLANNPLFVKHLRSRLRRPTLISAVLLVGFLCLCVVWFNFQIRGPFNQKSNVGSHLLFWLQSVILVFVGGSQVATAVAQMKSSGIIDFHRITPLPPSVQTIGILLGVPIREFVLYAVTLPFGLFLALEGPLGLANYGVLILVQLASALMWFSFAMVIGLTAAKARGASGQYTLTLIGLSVVANGFFAGGVYGPTLITGMPVYHEVFIQPEVKARQEERRAQQLQRGRGQPGPRQQRPPAQEEDAVPRVTFYGMALPLILQTVMFQGALLIFQFIAASRRLHSPRLPLYRKPTALLFLGTLAVLTLGSLWGSPSYALTLGAGYFLVFCSILLTNAITPPLGEIVKGVQRARKLSSLRVPVWSDLASNKFTVVGFAAITAAIISIGVLAAPQPAPVGNVVQPVFSPWPCLLVTILTILVYGFAKQSFALAYGSSGSVYFRVFLFIAWIAPFIIGMIIGIADVKEGAYVSAVSPIIGIAFAGLFQVAGLNATAIQAISLSTSVLFTAVFLTLLLIEERKLLQEVAEEHRERPGNED